MLQVPLWLQASTGDAAITYTATQMRQLLAALAVPGVTRKNDLKVSQRASGANMSVDVSAGSCVVPGTSLSNQGYYWCLSDAVYNITLAAAPLSGTRTDRIIVQVYDDQSDGTGLYSWKPDVVTGTAGAGAPPLPDNAITLAWVTVTAGQASVVSSNIVDKRLLNLMVDKPQWQLGGGNGQTIADGTNVTYRGWSYDNRIGVDTNANPGEVVCRQAAQYAVAITVQLDKGGTVTAERGVWVDHLSPTGTFIERVAMESQFPAVLGASAGPCLTGTGTVICGVGDILRGKVRQDSGVSLHIYDANNVARFTGALIGPV